MGIRMPQSHTPVRTRAKGFSIVEVMVALGIGSILLAGVLTVMYSSKVTYMENERLGRVQENGRAAMEIMLRDLRGAGFPGCAQPISGLFDLENLVSDPNSLPYNFGQPVFGFQANDTGDWTPALDATIPTGSATGAAMAGNDVLVVRTVRSGSAFFRVPNQTEPGTASIDVVKDPSENLQPGSTVVLGDCGGASVFVATGFTASADGTGATITHTTGGTAPTNTSEEFGFLFTPNAHISPIVTVVYYIAPSAAGGPALWRIVGSRAPEEVIQGVEDLQLRFGIDTDMDTVVNKYVEADGIAAADWPKVISVSLAMVVRSSEANAPAPDTAMYTLFDATGDLPAVTYTAPGDRFQRSVFTTTVALRNRTT